jgi:hypothetical protein
MTETLQIFYALCAIGGLAVLAVCALVLVALLGQPELGPELGEHHVHRPRVE